MILLILCTILFRVVQQLFSVLWKDLISLRVRFLVHQAEKWMPILARYFIAPLATNNKRKHNARTVSLFLGCRQCKNRIQQTQNRKTLPENRNTNPKTEINTPKRKQIQNKNTKLNHKTEREFKNTNHDQKLRNRKKEII